MPVYTVQAPPDALGEPELARAVVLRESFSWAAFFFGIFWLVWKGLWMTAIIWIALFAGLAWLNETRLALSATIFVGFLLHVLLGLEGRALLRGKFARQNYRLVDVVVADGSETAERLSFHRIWRQPNQASASDSAPPPPSPLPPQHHDEEILGLFPHPEERR